jgi:hypothetical protein
MLLVAELNDLVKIRNAEVVTWTGKQGKSSLSATNKPELIVVLVGKDAVGAVIRPSTYPGRTHGYNEPC